MQTVPTGIAIKTKYRGAVDSRLYSVIVATCKRTTTTWTVRFRVDNALSDDGNHFAAASKLIARHLPGCNIVAKGYDRDGQYFIAVNK